MKKRPTILDVADKAGVSKSTVSLVLQNSPSVRPSTREDVNRAISDLGYVYNRSAAGLRGAASGLIGLIINDLRNPFFTEFAASAQMEFARKGYSTVIANTDEDPGNQAQVIGTMIEHGVSAFVISPAYGGGDNAFDRIEHAGIPTMQVLRQIDNRTGLFPFATHNYAAGGEMATHHLIDLGCRKIAFVGGLKDRPITNERMSGYRTVMTALGYSATTFHGRPSRAFGREMALTIASEHPEIEAAICFSDLVALGMLSGFAEAGVKVGEDFRLVGFDDIEESSLVYPRLSSIRCDTELFGQSAAQAMLTWIVDDIRPPDVKHYDVNLIDVSRVSGLIMSDSPEGALSSPDTGKFEALLHSARALIFDCDGTLVKTPDLYGKGWRKAFRNAGLDMELAWYHLRAGMSEHVLMDAYEQEHNVKLDRERTVQDLRTALLQDMPSVREIQDVASVARRFHGLKPMAVASGGPREIVRASLDAAGLLQLFDTVVTIDDVNNAKPAPDLFLEAAERLGVTSRFCLVFEDSPQGLQAAGNAGMSVIDVNGLI